MFIGNPQRKDFENPGNGNHEEPKGQDWRGHLTCSSKTRDSQQNFYRVLCGNYGYQDCKKICHIKQYEKTKSQKVLKKG